MAPSRRACVAVGIAALAAAAVAVGRSLDRSPAVPAPGAAEHAEVADAAFAITRDAQATWAELLRQGWRSYSEARLVTFRGPVRSECGWDERAVAPFYCPADEKLYLDLDFAAELAEPGSGGAEGLAYVVAHGIGHHVQALTGVERRVQRDARAQPAREGELVLAMELQADCFAGVWAKASGARLLTAENAASAIAAVVTIAARRRGGAHEGGPSETWLHSDPGARLTWLTRGMAAGDPDACDTFATPLE